MTDIGLNAFQGCSGLDRIYSLNPVPPTVIPPAFSHDGLIILYVPRGSAGAYSNKAGWTGFRSVREF